MNWHQMTRTGLWALAPVLLALMGCRLPSAPVGAAAPWELSLSASDWQITSFKPGQGVAQKAFSDGYPRQNVIAAIVPGDVHWDLERNGKLPPIYYSTNSQQTGWVAEKEWWYRKAFFVPAGWQGKTVRLHFDGVDYLADVWLNGQPLGRHEGQFTPFEFEVTKQLQSNQGNILTVLIHPGPEPVRQAIASRQGDWAVMGVFWEAYSHWKTPAICGWDWGTPIISMGIARDVRLVASEGVYLANPIVLPRLSAPYDEATLETRLTVAAEKPQSVELVYRVYCLTAPDQAVLASQKIEVAAGARQVTFQIKVPRPQLWWPRGYGKQHLYKLEVAAKAAGGAKDLHVVQTTFGIRDLQLLSNPEAEADNPNYLDHAPGHTGIFPMPKELPEHKYLMQINGRRIFARGSNFIPSDMLYGRPRRDRYEYLVRSAAEANFNLFRLWGCGIIEKSDLYELCDQYGIMVYQEFWQGTPKETDEALAIAARETREVLPLLMNHPSVVRYGGGNEMYLNARISRQMAQLRAICNEVDPTRPYYDPDPETMFQRHGNYWYEASSNFYLHYRSPLLNGRHSGPPNPMEWNEFGVAGAVSVESLKAIMPASSLWPVRADNPDWIWHKGFNACFDPDNWLGRKAFTALFGPAADLPTLVRQSQFAQAEGLRYACQSMRRFRWHRSSCATWVYNEPWPNAAHNGIMEYYGRKPMAYYYVKQAYAAADILAVYSSLEAPEGKPWWVELWGINDHLQPLSGYRCRYRITDLHGKMLAEQTILAEVPAEGNIKIGDIEWTPPAELSGTVALVWLDLLDASGKAVAQHLYTFGVPAPAAAQKPLLAAMINLPRTQLESHVVDLKVKPNGETEATIEIQNVGQVPALFVKTDVVTPEVTNPASIPMLDWVYFDENYFSLQPREIRRVRMTLAAKAPKQPTVCVEAWNVDSVQTISVTK
jgi:beta-mannosidase